jgi:ribosomal protein S25
VQEITTVLFYDDLLRNMFLGENMLKDNSKNKIEKISEASRFSANKIRHWTRRLKEENLKELIEYKQKNNLLTYRDIKKSEKIYGDKIMDRIREEVSLNKKASYSDIAGKFGLKNSSVVSKIIREAYKCEEKDLVYRLNIA